MYKTPVKMGVFFVIRKYFNELDTLFISARHAVNTN
jgi:hypothetical protein